MSFLFAWRYFKGKKSTNAINIISWISIVAITFATASLILVLSVFNGFEGLVKSLYSSFYPDLRILPAVGKQLTLTQAQINQLRSLNGVSNLSLVAEEKAFLKVGETQSIVNLRGVDSAYKSVSVVDDKMVNGEFRIQNGEQPLLVVGAGVEYALGIQADRSLFPVFVYLPRKGDVNLSDPFQSLSVDSLFTAGTFYVQQDFDNKYAFTSLGFVKSMLSLSPDVYSSVEIKTSNPAMIEQLQRDIAGTLGTAYKVQNRFEQNQSLFSIMEVEKWFIFAILSLIMVVAAFNIIGSLTMLVLDKKLDMAVLNALGADKNFIRSIFLSTGVLIGLIGAGLGMFFALLLGWAQQQFKLIALEGTTFMVDYFPVKMLLRDFLLVGFTVIIIALFASWLPANRAANRVFARVRE